MKFADARPSSFEEIKSGDQVRVLGERNEDGTQMKAEAIVSGTFRNLAGTVIAVNPSGDEVSIKDLDTKKPVLVKLNADSMVRRMPPMMAQAIAARAQNRAQGQGGSGTSAAAAGAPGTTSAAGGPGNWQRPAGAGPGAGQGNWQGGGGGGRGFGDPQQMLERLPPMPVIELKPGDAVIVAGAGSDPASVNAIALVAGVEPILTAPRQAGPESVGGSWNLDINIVP